MYIPNKIISLICFPKVPVENEYPHLTVMCKDWRPVQSNEGLEVMLKNQEISRSYIKLRNKELEGEELCKFAKT